MDNINSASSDRDPRSSRINALLSDARRRLIEIGTRNRLVHTNRRAKKPSTLAVLYEDTDLLFQQLVVDNRSLRFRSDARIPTQDEISGFEPPADNTPPTALSANVLQTRLGEEHLQARLLKFFREARTLEEEQGINILYLAMGFLRWYEDENSQVLREAPLILVPVSLIRDVRRSTFDLKFREDDISTNLPLAERLKEFGITLPEIPEDEGTLRPSEYFEAVERAVQNKSRWSVDRKGSELGLFSFAKLLMFRDLAGEQWPGEAILEHPIIAALLSNGFEREEQLFSDNEQLDLKFEPSDLMHVLDADGSQTLAIETARAGRNLVIQGPPGTGKSQTIANIIAGAVYDGKTVLFVAEKMVALKVVHARLVRAGLGNVCLELHSRAANKRAVAEELGRTINYRAAEQNAENEGDKLKRTRDRLNYITQQLHTPIQQSNKTPFNIIGDLSYSLGANRPPPELLLTKPVCVDGDRFRKLENATSRLVELLHRTTLKNTHPYRGVQNTDIQPTDFDRLKIRLRTLHERLQGTQSLVHNGATLLECQPPSTLRELEDFASILDLVQQTPLEKKETIRLLAPLSEKDRFGVRSIAKLGLEAQAASSATTEVFQSAAITADVSRIRNTIARGAARWLVRMGSAYRSACRELGTLLRAPLPKAATARLTLADKLIEAQSKLQLFQSQDSVAVGLLSTIWRGLETDFEGLLIADQWISLANSKGVISNLERALFLSERGDTASRLAEKLRSEAAAIQVAFAEVIDLLALEASGFEGKQVADVSFAEMKDRLTLWAESYEEYRLWVELLLCDREIRALGAHDVADRLADGRLAPVDAISELRQVRAEVLWKEALKENPALVQALKEDRTALVLEFQDLERQHRSEVAHLIRARHAAAMPSGAFGEMAVIRGEIARRRGHMPIRKLMERAARTIQLVKPVFLMSPISVAQFIPPGKLSFDLVVIDEASQVRPEDAFGVIARTGQVVVVGDRKQLPPTSFFSRLLEDDADDDQAEPTSTDNILAGAAKATDLESILTLCEARGMPDRMLRWHYRSHHPSLIEVSNVEFYRGNLFLPPAPIAERISEGLLLKRIEGAYDRGGKRTNLVEAQAVVEAVAKHASEAPNQSLGIVTFSTSQRDIVSDLLDERRRTDPILDAFLNSELEEEVFVKNLENVQGDERDIILVSVGYGPRQAGSRLDSMAFGPVSADGGERRLNVLFTRARRRCEIFVSFDPGDIDLDRVKGEGARVLKRFLTYAATGNLDQPIIPNADHDSFFEEDVANVIRAFGYLADAQVGSVGFKIDLGVRNPAAPGKYILAVECDGAPYHSALWARERDRLRQEVLELKGWRFHRIWSTDWFYRRNAEIKRLKAALDTAELPSSPTIAMSREQQQGDIGKIPIQIIKPKNNKYPVANFFIELREEPHEVPVARMADIVKRIVEIEGPIHVDEVGRRIATLCKKERAGSRIAAAAHAALLHRCSSDSHLHHDKNFWFTTGQKENCPVRDRSVAPSSVQRTDMLPPLEIAAAAMEAVRENGPIGRDEIAVAVARLLGFQRTGPDLRASIEDIIVEMIKRGALCDEGGVLARPTPAARTLSLLN